LDIVLIVKSLVGLVALLGILIMLLLYKSKKQEISIKEKASKPKMMSFEQIMRVVRDRKSTSEQLEEAVNTLLKRYPKIPPKHGIRLDNAFYNYSEIMVRLCRHPNITKEILLRYDQELIKCNPKYQKEIDDVFSKGLQSRGM